MKPTPQHSIQIRLKHLLAGNIPRYFIYTAIKSVGFGLFLAIWVYLQRERGLNLSQAALIDVTFWVAATLGEIPTGIVADRYGRKTSLMVGMVLISLSTFAWVLAPTLPLIMVAYACLGIGVTFLSGAEDALFYESVQRAGRTGEYTSLVGRASATATGALALGSVLSGLLAAIDLRYPFLIAGMGYLIALGIVLTFNDPRPDGLNGTPKRESFGVVLRQAVSLVRTRPALRHPMLYLALIPLAALLLETLFVQPQVLALEPV
jgi:MFS family permease